VARGQDCEWLNRSPADAMALFNQTLETGRSGYRFVNGRLVPISSPVETEAVEEAISSCRHSGLSAASIHIDAALECFSRRPEPDYRNSIKESISAVESVAKLISGHDKGGLKDALQALRKRGVPVHPALEGGFLQVYGWTSDADGIRHALTTEDSRAGFDEAKFMLVACSAFVNYLISKAADAGLLPSQADAETAE
jgi:hypothetical protein